MAGCSCDEERGVIDRYSFRDAMARLGAAVNVVTTDGIAGRHGLTASAVCSVTDDPPTLLVCINRASPGNAIIRKNGALCVNVLGGNHAELSARFACGDVSMADRFGNTEAWIALETGSPALIDAPVALDCRIVDVNEVGTHSVFFCEVVDLNLAPQSSALIWLDRAYHPIMSSIAA
jgi:flavin reductase